MAHTLYVLHSASLDRYYIGETVDLEARIAQHREGFFKGSYTQRATDWESVLAVECGAREKARALESFLKRMRNRSFLQRFVEDHAYRKDLLRERFGL